MKNQLHNRMVRISNGAAANLLVRSMNGLLLGSQSDESSQEQRNAGSLAIRRKKGLGLKMDKFAEGIREHVSLAPKFAESVKGKLRLGARILQVGGVQKVFKHLFSVGDDEKLLKACQCYLSTTAGPIAGLLFISTEKVAFCSERSIKFLSPTGKQLRIYYKVSIPLKKITRANASQNSEKPSQKYIEVVTEDNFDFWFMGFLNHQKSLKCIQQVVTCHAQ